MKKTFYLSLILFIIFASCKKDEKSTPKSDDQPKEEIIEIKTTFGTMIMWLNKKTPKHRANFIKLAGEEFYDNTSFHRCVSNFVIQGGDPLTKDSIASNDGTGGPGYLIDAEIDTSLYKHDFGAVGTARGNDPAKRSNGSQFYIVTQTGGSHALDYNYSVIGKIIKGMNVAITINKQPKASDKPLTKILMDVNLLLKTQAEITAEYGYSNFDW